MLLVWTGLNVSSRSRDSWRHVSCCVSDISRDRGSRTILMSWRQKVPFRYYHRLWPVTISQKPFAIYTDEMLRGRELALVRHVCSVVAWLQRRNRADLIDFLKMYKGFTTVHFESLFTLDCNNKSTRGHLAILTKPRCQKIFLFTSCN